MSRPRFRTRKASHRISRGSYSPGSSWRMVAPCRITTSRKNRLCTWCCACAAAPPTITKMKIRPMTLPRLRPRRPLPRLRPGRRLQISSQILHSYLSIEGLARPNRPAGYSSCRRVERDSPAGFVKLPSGAAALYSAQRVRHVICRFRRRRGTFKIQRRAFFAIPPWSKPMLQQLAQWEPTSS